MQNNTFILSYNTISNLRFLLFYKMCIDLMASKTPYESKKNSN